ncbi:MAG: four helix bundle protein [Acidobacteria bacterium]|nr:MAG: four helix bundle protein [Acidobacteriota bacterium]
MKNFEDLIVFKRAVALMVDVYRTTETFPKDERYGLTAQIRKASVSVVSHVAEGQGRLSLGEWRQFLSQARGSLYEVQAQAIAAHELGFLEDQPYGELRVSIRRVASPLRGLIAYVRGRERKKTTRQPDNPTTG